MSNSPTDTNPNPNSKDEREQALDWYKKVISGRDHAGREIDLQHMDGSEITAELTVVERKALLDQIQRLPDELLDVLSEADDPDEAEEEASEAGLLKGVSGVTLDAFEQICAMSLKHEYLSYDDWLDVAQQFDFEALFPIGAEVIQMSLEDTGVVKDFQIQD